MAKYFEWMESYSVGISELDDDHKVLVSLVNDLVVLVNGEKKDTALGEILERLMDYTVFHFGREERLFEETDYPEADVHRRSHDRFVRRLVEFHMHHRKKTLKTTDLATFLMDWLMTHIQHEDKRYSLHFRANGLN